MLLRCESLEPPMSQLVRLGRGGMSALSPFYPQLRTLVGAAGTAVQCQEETSESPDPPQVLSFVSLQASGGCRARP
jgi:hypothetical protein